MTTVSSSLVASALHSPSCDYRPWLAQICGPAAAACNVGSRQRNATGRLGERKRLRSVHVSRERVLKRRCQNEHKCSCSRKSELQSEETKDEEFEDIQQSLGVTIALTLLQFYRTEISPLLPGSCRYIPTCSEYSMQAYKKYGVIKGTILTAWRLTRCNPLGGSGFDPPRWFGECRPPTY